METFNVIAGVGALIAAAGTLFNSWQIFRLTGRVDHLTGRVDLLTGRVDELSRAVHVRPATVELTALAAGGPAVPNRPLVLLPSP